MWRRNVDTAAKSSTLPCANRRKTKRQSFSGAAPPLRDRLVRVLLARGLRHARDGGRYQAAKDDPVNGQALVEQRGQELG